jgi:hypothetical protein
MSNMEAMRTEQNSLGLVEGPTPCWTFTRSVPARTGMALI